MDGCALLVAVGTVGVLGIVLLLRLASQIRVANREAAKARRVAQAEREYLEQLWLLMKTPGSPELRRKALELGRWYYGMQRKDGKPSIHDETTIMDDISAATSGTTQPPQ